MENLPIIDEIGIISDVLSLRKELSLLVCYLRNIALLHLSIFFNLYEELGNSNIPFLTGLQGTIITHEFEMGNISLTWSKGSEP